MGSNASPGAAASDCTRLTDIHILTHQASDGSTRLELEKSLLFPGGHNAQEVHRELLEKLLEACLLDSRDDFMVDLDGAFYRVRRDRFVVDGIWYRLRRMSDEPPRLDSLPSALPGPICEALMNHELLKGGLVVVVGGPGCGKTTTASATVVSRLLEFGGIAYTVEDPPELPLNGRHGRGYCTQSQVAGESTADWVASMRGALRSQPVGTSLIMYVGEIRDAECARMMMRAAANGFLVICTAFGTDIISAIDALLHQIGREYATSLAHLLRVVVQQSIHNGRLRAEILVSEGPSHPVSALIRRGELPLLKDEIIQQRNAMLARLGASAKSAPTTAK